MNNVFILKTDLGNYELIDRPICAYLEAIFKKNYLDDVYIVVKSNYFFLDEDEVNKILKIHRKSRNKISCFNQKTDHYEFNCLNDLLAIDSVLVLDRSLLTCDLKILLQNKIEKELINIYPIQGFYVINNLFDLFNVETKLKSKINNYWINQGVIIKDSISTTISIDTKISKNTIIRNGTSILGESIIGMNCDIGPYCLIDNSIVEENTKCSFSVIENSIIKKDSSVGPYAHLRQNTTIGEKNRIGNFVEIKNSTLGSKTNVAHLTYIGDTTSGDEVNWGCGSVTVNYDGKNKYPTKIGNKVFIGCNTNLIAPIIIESKSFIAAGSTITNNVDKGSFAIARAKQVNKEDYAKKYKFKEDNNIQVIKCNNYEEVSRVASEILVNEIKNNPKITLGLATGSTPIGTYKKLIEAYNKGIITFKEVKTYNLDEYVGLPIDHPETYYNFMHKYLFNHIDIQKKNIHIPFANMDNKEDSCRKYNDMLNSTVIDVQLLGIGVNGHIGFNEPGTSFEQETFVVELTKQTRENNKRFFNSIDEVPTHAITMGIKNIMNAKKIILLATGKNKAEAVKNLLSKKNTLSFPASVLHNHKDVVIIVDKDAAEML